MWVLLLCAALATQVPPHHDALLEALGMGYLKGEHKAKLTF